MQRLCTSTRWASREVSKCIIPQPVGAGMGKLPGFYANVTASLRDFYSALMISFPRSGILPWSQVTYAWAVMEAGFKDFA